MPMKVLEATLSTFNDAFQQFTDEAANNKANFILFLADDEPSTNLSWCPGTQLLLIFPYLHICLHDEILWRLIWFCLWESVERDDWFNLDYFCWLITIQWLSMVINGWATGDDSLQCVIYRRILTLNDWLVCLLRMLWQKRRTAIFFLILFSFVIFLLLLTCYSSRSLYTCREHERNKILNPNMIGSTR